MILPEKIEKKININGEKKVHFESRYNKNTLKSSKNETNPNYWNLFFKNKKFTEQEIFQIYNEMTYDEYFYLIKYCELPPFLIEKLAKDPNYLFLIYTTQNISNRFIERYKDKIDIPLMIFKNKRLDYNVTKEYIDTFNWNYYNVHEHYNWFLEKYKDHIDWYRFILLAKKSKFTKKFVKTFKDYLNLHDLIHFKKIDFEDNDKLYEIYGINLDDTSKADKLESLSYTLDFMARYQNGSLNTGFDIYSYEYQGFRQKRYEAVCSSTSLKELKERL